MKTKCNCKKLVSLLMTFLLSLSLFACASDPATEEPAKTTDKAPFPFVGTWANDEYTIYIRVAEDGTLVSESIVVNTSTSTINGFTTTSTSKSTLTNNYVWSLENDVFVFNGSTNFTPVEESGEYRLVGENITYHRVGDLDYVISMDDADAATQEDVIASAEKYTVGTAITAEGFELTLTTSGIEEDIRISSETSGIKITSGPSVEQGKKYVYLKGTLKNTGKSSISPSFAGIIYMDDYEFKLSGQVIRTSGNPTFSVEPLETVNVLLYAQVSDEMVQQYSEGKIIFGFNDNFETAQLNDAQYVYYVNITK